MTELFNLFISLLKAWFQNEWPMTELFIYIIFAHTFSLKAVLFLLYFLATIFEASDNAKFPGPVFRTWVCTQFSCST